SPANSMTSSSGVTASTPIGLRSGLRTGGAAFEAAEQVVNLADKVWAALRLLAGDNQDVVARHEPRGLVPSRSRLSRIRSYRSRAVCHVLRIDFHEHVRQGWALRDQLLL